MKLFNSLSNKKETFSPLHDSEVGMYSCGPTVYNYPSIGNYRTYFLSDLLRRVLELNGYKVKTVMNITDVGHLTGDNSGDADTGDDRLEKAAKKEGKTAWDVAEFYTKAFKKDLEDLNIPLPWKLTKATDHIKEQIELVRRLEEKGLTYKTSDGIYFDTKAYEEKTGKKYGELSTLDEIKEGARVKKNDEKKNSRDFALWKFSESPGERHMEWDSPWGLGFPGWHIECSAMSMAYLGESFDIHVGGEDLRSTHHPNEIAQSEGATGKQFVKYWVHGTFLQVDGQRMGKSIGNFITMDDIREKSDPMSLRYLYLTAHYKDPLNFTWKSLEAAQNALSKLREFMVGAKNEIKREVLSKDKDERITAFSAEFKTALNDDLNTPQALAVLWKVVKDNIPAIDKYDLIISFDEVLGLGLGEMAEVPQEVNELLQKRNQLRNQNKFAEADMVRDQILDLGFKIKDTDSGAIIIPANEKTT